MKTTTPCDKELLKKTAGDWKKIGTANHATVTKRQQEEIVKRLDVIHRWAVDIYPSPLGFDATAGYSIADQSFAAQVKIERPYKGEIRTSPAGGTPTLRYSYAAGFCDYHCGRNAYELMRGRGCEGASFIAATMNSLEPFFLRSQLDDFYADIMQIDGRPIRMMPVIKEQKWKGFDLYNPEGGSGVKMILLHREGMLPYIPVTRKQYLDRSIECLQLFYAKVIKGYEQPEGLTLLMDKKDLEDEKKKQQKIRDNVIKYYQDEVNATTKAGLLDAPAIIFGDIMSMYTQHPIFITQADGGKMLVTENPAYIKKELSKTIPQLIVYSWWDGQRGPDPVMDPVKLYDKYFPIEKLQAMIDK